MASSTAASASAPAAVAFIQRDLFGGAITCEIPADWKDISDIRQVPDHQECYQEVDGGNASLVIEILQRQDVSDAEAPKYFFDDLAEANGSTTSTFETKQIVGVAPTVLNGNAVLCGGIGYQRVAVGRDYDINGNRRHDQEIHSIRVELCVIRLPRVETDLLVTISRPITNPNEPDEPIAAIAFQRIVTTLTIRDWSLFG